MTVTLTLSDDEANSLAELIAEHGRVKATQRTLAERRNLLSRDQTTEPPATDRIVALVAVKLVLAQLLTQRAQAAAEYDAHALFSSIQLCEN